MKNKYITQRKKMNVQIERSLCIINKAKYKKYGYEWKYNQTIEGVKWMELRVYTAPTITDDGKDKKIIFIVYSADSQKSKKKQKSEKNKKLDKSEIDEEKHSKKKTTDIVSENKSSDYIIEEDGEYIRFMKEPNKSVSASSSGIIFNNDQSDTLKIRKKEQRGKKQENMLETVKDKGYSDRDCIDLDDSRACLNQEEPRILKTDPMADYVQEVHSREKDKSFKETSNILKLKIPNSHSVHKSKESKDISNDNISNSKEDLNELLKEERDKKVFYWSIQAPSHSDATLRAFSDDDYNVVFQTSNGSNYAEMLGYQEEIDPKTKEKVLYQIWSTGDNTNFSNSKDALKKYLSASDGIRKEFRYENDLTSREDVEQFFEPSSEENGEKEILNKAESKHYIKIDEGLEIPHEEDEMEWYEQKEGESLKNSRFRNFQSHEEDDEEEEKYELDEPQSDYFVTEKVNENQKLYGDIPKRLMIDSPGTNLSSLSMKDQSNEFLFQTREGIMIESSCGTTGRNRVRNLNLDSINQSGQEDKPGLILTDDRSELDSEFLKTKKKEKKKAKSQRAENTLVTAGKKTLDISEALNNEENK